MRKIFINASCARCGRKNDLTRHHYFPVRWYNRKSNDAIVILCRKCHTSIEEVLHHLEYNPKTKQRERLPHSVYEIISLLCSKEISMSNSPQPSVIEVGLIIRLAFIKAFNKAMTVKNSERIARDIIASPNDMPTFLYSWVRDYKSTTNLSANWLKQFI